MTTPTPHRCDNCDGIDPASCINAPTPDRTPTGDKTAQCGTSSRIGFHYLVPYIGPCVLRAEHDGPVHEDANGVQWTDPQPASEAAPLCTPTGDLPRCADCTCPNPGACPEQPAPLRDQLAEALQRHTVATALPTPFPPDLPETPWLEEARRANEARADAVLPVVEDETAALRQRAEELDAELRAVKIDRDEWRDRAHHWQATAGPPEDSDEYDLDTDPDALRRNLNEVIEFLEGRPAKMVHDAVWARVRPVLRIHREKLAEQRQRAEEAEAALAEVRRLQDMTIASSIRVQAIHQAEDTLAILNRHTKEADSA